MGKSKNKKKRHRRKERRPDEVFALGPIELARFGRLIVGRSNLDEAAWEKVEGELAVRYPQVVDEMDALVAGIAARVAGLPPGKLLQRAFWMFAMQQIRTGGMDAVEPDSATTMRMMDYVQSIIASTPPHLPYAEDIEDDAWSALRQDVGTLFRKLVTEFPMARTAWRRQQDPDLDMELEAFRVRTEMLWANVRGVRHQTEEREALAEVLEPHSYILRRLFGLDAAEIATEAEKIQTALTHGLMQTADDMETFRRDSLDRLTALAAASGREPADLGAVIRGDPVLERRGRDVMGRFLGLDLFDVRKTSALPDALLLPLSWAPGEDSSFFAEGDHRGWPLRVWPTMRRPFLRIDEQVLCFDRYSLFDNLYRAIQRVVLQLAPDYRTQWNVGQQAISEELPFRYLGRLLPGARVIRPIYYRWAPDGGRADWHEADGILTYDDHLFVVEVKGGAFTWTSPNTDLEAHLRSLTALVQAPARQAGRFLNYLKSTPEAVLYDADHVEVGRLRHSDYRHLTTCVVTLDPFTESAARAQHLRALGVNIGERPVWVMSVDDLRTYAQIFRQPLRFLHYVEQRVEAAQSHLVDLDDEMDHLGMYLAENQYGRLARELVGDRQIRPRFTGYRTAVDAFFAEKAIGENPEPPTQPVPSRLEEILSFLEGSALSGRSRLSGFLLDASGAERARMEKAINNALRDQGAGGAARPASLYGEHAYTLQVWTPAQPRDMEAALRHAEAVLAAAGEQTRLLLELVYDGDDRLNDVAWRYVGLAGLTEEQLAEAHAAGEALKRARVRSARAKGWIRPKAQCPCGSGRRFGDCHGGGGAG